jgi:purine-binding chemotaxis protein CheW
MTDEAAALGQGVSGLRLAFDRAFAEAPAIRQTDFDDFLAIRAGGSAYALRLAEISGLFTHRTVTRLPTTSPAFCGVAGFRGSVLPVYDLRVLLGTAVAGNPRWLVVARSLPIGFVFDGLDGHLRLPRSAGAGETADSPSQQPVVASADGVPRMVIRLPSICEEIRKGARAPA